MKTIRKAIAVLLVLLTIFTACSVSMPVLAAYEKVTNGNVVDKVTNGNVYEREVENGDETTILSEVIEKRSETEKHFLMSDGTFMVAKYSQPVHYQDNNGEWMDYDNSLDEIVATSEQTDLFGTDEIFSTNNSIENIVFAKKSNSNTLVSYEAKDYPISFNYQSAKKSNIKIVEEKAELEGDDAFLTLPNLTQEVLYENVFNKVDLQYFVGTDGLKENIILKSASAQNTFTVNYDIGSLTAMVVDSRTINLISGDELIYTISAPYMYDANGEKSENVALTVKKNKNGKLTLVLSADSEWIKAEGRAFPVTIDPSITTETTRNDIDSVMVSQACGNQNFSSQSEMIVGREPSEYGYCQVLTKFVLPELNKGDIVVDAKLCFLNYGLWPYSGDTPDMQVNAHRIMKGWDVTTVTWNNKPSYDSLVSDYDIFEELEDSAEWRYFDITKMVKYWYEKPSENYGVMLKGANTTGSYAENGVKAYMYTERYNQIEDAYPQIIITYRNNKGLEDYWTYTSLSAGNAGSAYINDYTGNLVFASNAVSTSNELMPLSIDCIYNGYVSDVVGFVGKSNSNQTWLGRGWRFSIQQTIIPSSSYGLEGNSEEAYPYVYTDGDGTEHYIYYNEDDDVYEDEDGLGLTLTIDDDSTIERYTLTDKKDNTLKFNSDGNLVESKNANDNKITISYNGKKIDKVTDGSGKEYKFVYVKEENGNEKNYVRQILHPSGEMTTFVYNLAASLAKITHTDGTVSYFTYEDNNDRSMLTAKDNENYQLSFEYTPKSSGKQIKTVTEYGNGTQGQKITFDRTKYNTTKIQTAGVDGAFDNDDDLITTYQFDNFGKTVTQQLSTKGGIASVAGTYEYTERKASSLASANKVTSAASLGKNVVNHVINGNAEKSSGWSTGVASATATYAYSSDAAYIGQKSILVNTTAISSENGTANARQSVTGLTGGKSYTLSAYVKTTETAVVHSGNSTGAYIALRTVDSSGNKQTKFSEFIPNDTSTSINKGWRRLVTTIQLPADCTSAYLYLGMMNATGKAYFDCVQLEEGIVANKYNLIENSSFEKHSNGLPLNWTVSNTEYTVSGSTVKEGITSGYKQEGNYSMRFSGEATEKKHVYQTIQVGGNANDTYILSGWAIAYAAKKAEHHEDLKFHIYIRVTYDNGGGGTYQEWKDPLEFNADIPGQWQYGAKAFTLKSKEHPTYKPLYVDISALYNYQINAACFDNIQLIKDVAQSYVYDDEGNVVSVSANAEQKDNIEYDDDKDDIQSYTDAAGFKTTYNFNDETHNLEKVTSPGRVETYFTYDELNGNQTETLLKSQDTALTIKNETKYTNATVQKNDQNEDVTVKRGSYVASTSDEHGNATVYFYNIIKDLTNGLQNVLGVFTHYIYDEETEQLKGVYTYKKDSSGNKIHLSAPVLYTYDKTKLSTIKYGSDTYSFTYDNFGNVVSTNVGGKPLSTNTYGANNGVLQSTTYGNGAVKNYTYDTFGNLAGVGNGSDTQYTWTYDSAMNPMTHIDSVNGLRYNYEYDGIGRLIRQELRDSENATHLGATEYTYDLRNNVTRISNEMGGRTVKQWYYYTAVDGVENSSRYAKENLPVRYYMSSSRHLSYNYDSLNRLTRKTLSTNTPLVSIYSYKMSNREANKEADDTNSYRTTQVSTEHSNKLVYFYEYDIAGNITNIKRAGSDGAGNRNTGWTNNYRSYTYDDLSQLTSETNATTGKTYTYTYDNVGNITSKSDGTNTITYTYGSDSDAGWSKLLTSYNGETIDYDSIGNPISYRGASLTWTGRQLDSYTKGDTSITYTYDADGLRGSKTVNGAKSTYQYVDGTLLYEDRNGTDLYYYYDSYGTITAISAYLPSGASGYVFVGTNSLGDVNALYNANGDLIVKYEYDAWGKVLAETDINGNALTGVAATWNELNPFRYRGYYYDAETQLYYINSRYYDAEVGRFVNADSQLNQKDGILGYNMFAYCHNNPIMYSDPTGHSITLACIIIGAVIGAVAGGCAGAYVSKKQTGKVNGWAVAAGAVGGGVVGGLVGWGVGAAITAVGAAATGSAATAAAPVVQQAVEKASSSAEAASTTVYRSISQAEAVSIQTMNKFSLAQGAMECKQFGFSLSETIEFGSKYGQNLIAKATVPNGMISQLYTGGVGGIDTPIFKSGTLTVPYEMLEAFNEAVAGTIQIMP